MGGGGGVTGLQMHRVEGLRPPTISSPLGPLAYRRCWQVPTSSSSSCFVADRDGSHTRRAAGSTGCTHSTAQVMHQVGPAHHIRGPNRMRCQSEVRGGREIP